MYTITLIPGDGIGPEVTEATCKVVAATGVDIRWERFEEVGYAGIEKRGHPLPDDVLNSIRRNRLALKGPVTTPVGRGFRSVNVSLRQKLDLFVNLRPCKRLPGIETPFPGVDLVIFRENTEGLYSGIESYDERLEIADSIARITRKGSQRILRYAFEWVIANQRKRLTAVHKANVLKLSTGLFLEEARRIAQEYPSVQFDHFIVDNMAMQLVIQPDAFDCIVTTNLFGDILSDLCAGLVGGLGIVPGANIGDEVAVFEAVHGSAPDIAGQSKANPTALIRSSALLLHHIGEVEAAMQVERAVWCAYEEGTSLTPDVGGTASTEIMTDRIVQLIAENA
ncbi:MAG: isocitrate/isopropylmalate dehydrogenase family protein [Rhodothermaceae bacterium]|nr:isocitrate/isopropylmalate dehydrogenase family protein [Rhodothermaceae bacterium]MYG69400.1 isocitrate/isopropylmalate dehydrogenase family protein [Rhodothermaceae bacterium]MYJ43732.1 isocitrate/isopropylmalate dehydrogenase family protein [Rhodothermaceae bacterium]